MENRDGQTTTNDEEIILIEDDVFDPSDYLPRRTSRASAHAASKAIKKSTKDDKTNSSQMNAASDEVKKENDGIKKQKAESLPSGKIKSAKKPKAKKRSHSPYDCFVKVVRCEDDPILKTLVTHLDDGQKISEEPNYDSKYEVIYAPVCASEKKALAQIPVSKTATVLKTESSFSNSTVYPKNDRKVGHVSSSKQSTLSGASSKPSSLSVVVVHPKPGSKIINTNKGRESKSAVLHKMISDPNTIISNKVSRVMTTGGKKELKCTMCSKTFAVARDLINHKRMAHKTKDLMCTYCAGEFSTQSALDKHACKAKYRCEICGVCCKQPGHLATHKKMAHAKTLGGYMCYVCCFNANSQQELDSHICGGKPKIVYSAQASSSVMVYPTHTAKSKPGTSVPQPNIYIDISSPTPTSSSASMSDPSSSSNKGMQYLCEVCLNMYPDSAALASHKCDSTVVVDPDPVKKTTDPPGVPSTFLPPPDLNQPLAPLSMEVMPEVEQLAKFYSSVVFSE